jgi:hypothetical protein
MTCPEEGEGLRRSTRKRKKTMFIALDMPDNADGTECEVYGEKALDLEFVYNELMDDDNPYDVDYAPGGESSEGEEEKFITSLYNAQEECDGPPLVLDQDTDEEDYLSTPAPPGSLV